MSSGSLEDMLKKMQNELQELKDREAIREVIARYNKAIDRLDRDMLIDCYHPDAVDDHAPFFTGSREDFADFALPNMEENYEASFYHVGTTLIEIDGDVARSESYVIAPKILKARTDEGGRQMIHQGARFLDRLERRDEEWRISHRTLVGEWEIFVPMQTKTIGQHVFPKGPATGAAARRDRSDPSYNF